jgi:uncharacterized protein (DUF1330 family)
MHAYAIFIRERIRDPQEIATYSAKAGASLEGHACKVLAAYGTSETLEGPEADGVVIVEFPSLAEAKAWYDGEAYSDARKHRFLGADYRAIFVEGT